MPTDEHCSGNLTVCRSDGGLPRNLCLLWSQVDDGSRGSRPNSISGCTQRPASPVRKRVGAHVLEELQRCVKLEAAVGSSVLVPKPFAVEEVGSGDITWNLGLFMEANGLTKVLLCVVVFGPQGFRAGQKTQSPSRSTCSRPGSQLLQCNLRFVTFSNTYTSLDKDWKCPVVVRNEIGFERMRSDREGLLVVPRTDLDDHESTVCQTLLQLRIQCFGDRVHHSGSGPDRRLVTLPCGEFASGNGEQMLRVEVSLDTDNLFQLSKVNRAPLPAPPFPKLAQRWI